MKLRGVLVLNWKQLPEFTCYALAGKMVKSTILKSSKNKTTLFIAVCMTPDERERLSTVMHCAQSNLMDGYQGTNSILIF